LAVSLKNLGAVTLFVEDLASAKAFYQGVFGLEIMFEDEQSVAFDFGNTIVNVLTVPAAHDLIQPGAVAAPGAGARAQFTIWVDDTDALVAQLAERGVALLNGPLDRPWGQRTAAFADPSGHIWEIAQHIAGS
jgi:catechol 2,3-dioxygenase-like lactoylglutathione lyase family enzyme